MHENAICILATFYLSIERDFRGKQTIQIHFYCKPPIISNASLFMNRVSKLLRLVDHDVHLIMAAIHWA